MSRSLMLALGLSAFVVFSAKAAPQLDENERRYLQASVAAQYYATLGEAVTNEIQQFAKLREGLEQVKEDHQGLDAFCYSVGAFLTNTDHSLFAEKAVPLAKVQMGDELVDFPLKIADSVLAKRQKLATDLYAFRGFCGVKEGTLKRGDLTQARAHAKEVMTDLTELMVANMTEGQANNDALRSMPKPRPLQDRGDHSDDELQKAEGIRLEINGREV